MFITSACTCRAVPISVNKHVSSVCVCVLSQHLCPCSAHPVDESSVPRDLRRPEEFAHYLLMENKLISNEPINRARGVIKERAIWPASTQTHHSSVSAGVGLPITLHSAFRPWLQSRLP